MNHFFTLVLVRSASSHIPHIALPLLMLVAPLFVCFFFFFNDTATTEIYTLSLHDALPIYSPAGSGDAAQFRDERRRIDDVLNPDRKSTRLNSSHTVISYAVFCLKKKTTGIMPLQPV